MKKEKLFVVKKYVMATCAAQALRKESKIRADECWIDDDYKKNMAQNLSSAIGFTHEETEI